MGDGWTGAFAVDAAAIGFVFLVAAGTGRTRVLERVDCTGRFATSLAGANRGVLLVTRDAFLLVVVASGNAGGTMVAVDGFTCDVGCMEPCAW